ncbi:MAG: SUMF1/EgtB/PvdO family nonheme iron enzyme [Candidatus Sumerlaeia bacterium]
MTRSFVSWMWIVGALMCGAPAHAAEPGNGDLSGDGIIGAADHDLLRGYLIGTQSLTSAQSANADLNGDGRVDIADLVLLVKSYKGQITVNVTPDQGSWTLTGPAGFILTGSGDRLGTKAIANAAEGVYTLRCNPLGGYATPADMVSTLTLGASIAFTPIYPRLSGNEITIYLPGGVPLQMIRCNPGTFMMGCAADEPHIFWWEAPQHQVTLTKPFYLGKYEVTKAQWLAVTGKATWPSTNPNPIDRSIWNVNPQSPAVNMAWDDITTANGFAAKLQQYMVQTGQAGVVRLPTNAEWEYACRAGTTTWWYWGQDPGKITLYEHANESGDHLTHPANVGEKLPNPWGFYDMSGNVCEWVQDWLAAYPTGPVTDPISRQGERPVNCGGTQGDSPLNCHSACRPCCAADYTVGFRLAMTP